MIPLAAFEEIIDASGVPPRIEAMLPIGVRARQLSVRTLLAGMLLALADHRPAQLTRVHQALISLPEDDQRTARRLADWKHGPHLLTYRQAERTFSLVARALGKDEPDGLPSGPLQRACDDLLEASVPEEFKDASTSLAVDWTDLESFSRPPPRGTSDCADPEASWGHRKNNLLRSEDELFYGYYLSAGVMMPEENGPAVPELARRAALSSCRHDPVRAFAPVLTAMPARGSRSATSLMIPATPTATPAPGPYRCAAAGAQLVQDLHPHDRGPKGTHDGAVISNGNLYCPRTPRAAAGARAARPHRHERAGRGPGTQDRELARYKLGRLTADDADGYHRVQCPAAMGKIRCPLRPASMTLDRDRPEILSPAGAPPGLLHPADHHRPAGRRSPRPRRSTTTRPRPGAAPTPAAPAPNAASPPSRTPPPATSPAAGAASWAWPPSCCSPRAARRPQPAHPRGLEHPAGRQPAPRRRRPAAENPQTAPQDPRHARRRAALTSSPPTTHRRKRRHPPGPATGTRPAAACPETAPDTQKEPGRHATAPTRHAAGMSDPNVKIGPHRNVKTSRWS